MYTLQVMSCMKCCDVQSVTPNEKWGATLYFTWSVAMHGTTVDFINTLSGPDLLLREED